MAVPRRWTTLRRSSAAVVVLLALSTPASAQSFTEGSLRGRVILADGTPVSGVRLALKDVDGSFDRLLKSDFLGRFDVPVLPPGEYVILAEQAGFQPVRQRGITIVAGSLTDLRIRLTRRPPPITSVEEVAVADQHMVPAGPRIMNGAGQDALQWPGTRSDLSEAGGGLSQLPTPLTNAWGLADAVGGRPQTQAQLYVDGFPGGWLRHPAIPGLPAGAPAYPRYFVQQFQMVTNPVDAEYSGGSAGTITGVSRRGSERFRLQPFFRWSGAPGIPSALNAGDSSVTSIQAGTLLSGTLVKGRATFALGFHYEELELPTARPWARNQASFGGTAVPLAATLRAVASDSFGANVGGEVTPPVRATRGGAAAGRLDWRVGRSHVVVGRFGFSRWRERKPEAFDEPQTGASVTLEGRDGAGGVALISSWPQYANELRVGFRAGRRDWEGPLTPATQLISEGAGLGVAPAWPGLFKRTTLDLSDALQYEFGQGLRHSLKIGLNYSLATHNQDYLYGQQGIFQFADLDAFGNGQGVYFTTQAPRTEVEYQSREIGLYGQVTWRPSARLQLLAGLRWDRERLSGATIRPDTAFQVAFGLRNNRLPDDPMNLAPRLGLTWEGGARREWLVTAGATMAYASVDPGLMSEALLQDGSVEVRRGVGSFTAWPLRPDSVAAPLAGRRFTLFSPSGDYRMTRTSRINGQVRRSLGRGVQLTAQGGYHHTDYLLARTDLNLQAAPSGTTQEGRPVFGTLVQQGGLVVAQPGSNRRLPGYDLVSALSSTGAADYYEAGLTIERQLPTGLSLAASYTWSRAEDNVAQAWTGDPADQLSPFPGQGAGQGWVDGRSDFDIPHRAAVSATWRTGGRTPFSLGARYRVRSGRPFTAGFPDGVDANGDGSGRNDPAAPDPTIPGMAQLLDREDCLQNTTGRFAARNGCREPMVHGLDLHLAVGLPVRSLGTIQLTVDAFNVVSTERGLVDHAAVLVDPAGTVSTDPQGNVTLPLVANPRFGKLLSRRDPPRMLWFGVRVGH